MFRCAKRCGRMGAADRLTALRGWIWMLITLNGWIRHRGRLGRLIRRGGRDRKTMVHRAKRRRRMGAAESWYAAPDPLTTLNGWIGHRGRLGRLRRGGRIRKTMLHCTKP